MTYAITVCKVCRTVHICLYSVIRGATLFIAEHHSAGQLRDKVTWMYSGGGLLAWVWAGGGPLARWHSKEKMRSLINSRVPAILGKVFTE